MRAEGYRPSSRGVTRRVDAPGATRHNRAHVDGRDHLGLAPGLAEPGVAARLNDSIDRITARTPGRRSGVSSWWEAGM